ncbi:hypothetical protein V8C44DRAFT_296021 [Trichoderma aethiopicum]
MYPGPWLLSPNNTPWGRYETIDRSNRQQELFRCFSNQGSWCTFCLTCIRSLPSKKQCKQEHVLQPWNREDTIPVFLALDLSSAAVRSTIRLLPLVSSPPLESGPLHELRRRRRCAGGIHSRSSRSRLEGGGKKPMVLLQVHYSPGPVAVHLQFGNGKPFDLATGLAACLGRCSSTRPETTAGLSTNGSDDSRRPS